MAPVMIHSTQLLPRHLWVSKKNRSTCMWCIRPFTLFRHRQHCRLCGDLFCKNCIVLCKTSDSNAKVCRLCMPSMHPQQHRRRSLTEGIKLLDTARCVEYSTPKTSHSSPNSPCYSMHMAATPGGSIEATLAILLYETGETQSALAAQNATASKMLGTHSQELDRLHRAIARLETKLWRDNHF